MPSAALLGAGFINCALYGIMRFYMLATKCLGHDYTGSLLVLFGVASILVAAPFVVVQRNFRWLLAYSSIDHAGIMVAALGFSGKLGALGAVLHMVFHAVAKPLMFFCVGNVQQHYGKETFKQAVAAMCGAAEDALRQSRLTLPQIKCIIPHQSNRRIIDAFAKRMGATPDQVFGNLEKFGNTSAASIPIALADAVETGRVKPGDLILLVAFGSGLTWGATVVEW